MRSNYELDKSTLDFCNDVKDAYKYLKQDDKVNFTNSVLKILEKSKNYTNEENQYMALRVYTILQNDIRK